MTPEQEMEAVRRHPLASLQGLALVCALLQLSGSTCPDCGYGTRATSKRWAACKKCGRARIARCSMDEAAAKLKEVEALTTRTPQPADRTI